jgi:hypothetical protein
MSKHTKPRQKVGFKTPPKHSQFKKGHSGNPNGRPRKYDPAAERKQLKALLELLKTRPNCTPIGKNNPKSMNYILWLIKELEIQIRLQVCDRVAATQERNGGKNRPPK